jgi:iron(III) transport system substrate-binding protein
MLFERRHPEIKVIQHFDVDTTKSIGFAKQIASKADQPEADVFWNNELLNTLDLEKKGLLRKINWDIPSDWPREFKSSQGNWVGIAAAARVLLVNRNLLTKVEDWPNSIFDLANPKWAKQCGLAWPLCGTTAAHFAVLFEHLGEQKAMELFNQIAENAVVLKGNTQVALEVASGRLAWGLTDSDDAMVELDAGTPVEMIYPDQEPHQIGALRIPGSVAVIKGGPHPVSAELLANFLVSEDTEGRLAMGSCGQTPIRPGHPQVSRALVDQQGQRLIIRWMDVDFFAAAEHWPEVSQKIESIFKQ